MLGLLGHLRKSNQTNWLKESEPQERLQSSFRRIVVWSMLLPLSFVPPEDGPVQEVREKVRCVDRNERPSDLERAEPEVGRVRDSKGFQESEDQSVRESRQERQEQDDGFADKHLEWSKPDLARFLQRYARPLQFVRSIDIRILTTLTTSLCFAIHEDGRAAFRHEEVDGLNHNTEDELDPEVPLPGQVLFDWAADDSTNTGADGRGQYDEA